MDTTNSTEKTNFRELIYLN